MAEIISHILGIFLGALLGIPAGVALNHAIESRAAKARKQALLDVLREAIRKNTLLVRTMEGVMVDPDGTPFFTLDLQLLDATSKLKYQILDDLELCREIDNVRYEMGQISRLVETLIGLYFDPSGRLTWNHPTSNTPYGLLRPRLAAAISGHLEPLKGSLARLQERLEH